MGNLDANFTIDAIDEALTEEEREILSITRGGSKVTIKQILKGKYGKLYSRFTDKDEIIVRTAMIMDNNRHNFEKLKQRDEYIKKLADPESFSTINTLEGTSKKDAGVISTSDGSSESISAGHTKAREGSSQYGLEFPLDDSWDRQDSELLESVLRLKAKSPIQNKWAFNAEGKLELTQTTDQQVTTKPTPGQPQIPEEEKPLIDIQDLEGRLEEEQIYLHTVALGSGRSANVAKGVSTSIVGRTIKSGSQDEVRRKTFVTGRAIDAVQKTQLINFRERIINQFRVLFTRYPCR